ADDGHGARRRERRGHARVSDCQPRTAHPRRRSRPAVARDRGPRRALGRGLPRDRLARAGRERPARGLRGVLRGRTGSDAARRERTRRTPGRVEGLRRPRLPPRARDRPFDRDDDDRVPEDRRGRGDGARGEHGLLDAPPRDLGGRERMPLHAGHVARHLGRRRAAGRAADADLRRLRVAAGVTELELDFPGLEIGVAEYDEGPTGCTVFHFPAGAAVATDVRGGSTGTIGGTGEWLHAVCFAGGSAYGLEAATGAAAELFARRGYSTAWTDIAVVFGAIIFDFGRRDNAVYPDKELGRAAVRAARPGRFPLGARGAGRS